MNSDAPVSRVHKVRIYPPITNADLVNAEMRGKHAYQNVLVEIERAFRASVRETEFRHAPDLFDAFTACEKARAGVVEALDVVKAARASTRSRSETEAMSTALEAMRQGEKEALRLFSAARKKLYSDKTSAFQHDLDVLTERRNTLRRGHRALKTISWGTSALADSAVDQAGKMHLYDRTDAADPHFSRWVGEGSVGVQIQGGRTLAELESEQDPQVRLEKVGTWLKPARRVGTEHLPHMLRRKPHKLLSVRVGSTGKGNRIPIFATFPLANDGKDIPDDALVMAVRITRNRIGPHEEWYAIFTLRLATAPARRCGEGTVAADLGWRLKEDGSVRICTFTDDKGQSEELLLPARTMTAFRKVEDVRSIRDKAFDVMKAQLTEWMSAREIPEWLQKATGSIAMWRSAQRLASLTLRWRENRFIGDSEIYGHKGSGLGQDYGSGLEGWRAHDKHLWTWESHFRTKTLRARKDLYRCAAAKLAGRYRTIVLEKFNLSKVAERPTKGSREDVSENETARYQRHTAAPSELRMALEQAMTAVLYVPAPNTTKCCSICLHIDEVSKDNISHRCSKCGATWDQDENAGHNMLRLIREGQGSAEKPRVSRKPKVVNESNENETPRARARRLASERKARHQGPLAV